jgi:hypothetical protein
VHSNPQPSLELSNAYGIEVVSRQDLNLLRQFSAELKSKLHTLSSKGININALLLELLQKRSLEIAREKEKIAKEIYERAAPGAQAGAGPAAGADSGARTIMQASDADTGARTVINCDRKPSRYIPVKIKKIIAKEHGTKCSISHCPKPAQAIHHTQRFSLAGTHDPNFMAPLCKEHHTIAHSADLKFHEIRARAARAN